MNTFFVIFILLMVALLGFAAFDNMRPRCIVCKSRGDYTFKFKAVDGLSGCGGFVTIPYHQKCLKAVVDNPEHYDDTIIFNLNSVVGGLKDRNSCEKSRLDYFKKTSAGLRL